MSKEQEEQKAMAEALDKIYKCKEALVKAEKELQRVSTHHPPFEKTIITIDEVANARAFEERGVGAQGKLAKVQENLQEAETKFRDYLPKMILKAMEEEEKAVHADYNPNGLVPNRCGPYAAYFEMGKLIVKPYKVFLEFEIEFNEHKTKAYG